MNLFFKKTNNISKVCLVGLILIIVSVGTEMSAFAKPLQVAVVPFKVNAEKDLSFLKDGIVDMLSSRLFWEDKVNIIPRQATEKASAAFAGPLNENKARKLGTRLGADYVLFGSLTVFGNSVSIDAKMVDVSGKKQTLTFFNQSQGMDQVIPGINLFASDINEKEFGRVMETRRVAPAAGASSERPEQAQADVRAHPDKLIAGGIAGGEVQGNQKAAPGSAFITTQLAGSQSTNFWKSRSIKQRITGMAIGDIDGDGKKETVFTTEHTVEAYRYDNQRFRKISTLAERNLDHLIGVDVADINGNGVAEIYVSALNPHRKYVRSFVMEFSGKSYVEIVKTTNWYLRVVDVPQRGKVLIGQKQGLQSPFDKPVFELVWQNSGYDSADRVLGAKRANVMGFSLGHAMNDGSEAAVVFDKLDCLRVYDSSGKEIWKDLEKSGGTPHYFELPDDGAKDMKNYAYYPMRILIKDINKDGKNDVITVKNHRASELISFRSFTGGEIEIRNWDGIGLAVLWKTRKLSGYFSDFCVGDFDNDGQDELVAALVQKTGSVITTKPKSKLIAYELK
ncbi:MAG: VCBS repeat-containing protein [Deltaproteobacteria bacterium]|nr:VCBS repeat-containing protein [Deltaproteobacteria bacterium]